MQELGGCLIYFEGVRNGSQALPLIQQVCISHTQCRYITTQAERNRPNKNAGKRGIGAHIYHSFSRLQNHSIKKESTPRHEFTEEGSTSSACKCSEKAQRGRIPTLLHIPTPKPPIKNHVVCTLRIEGRSNTISPPCSTTTVVCTLRIEGRSNHELQQRSRCDVVCTLRIEGRSNKRKRKHIPVHVVCTLRIEGRSNVLATAPPRPCVVCTLRIEGRSNPYRGKGRRKPVVCTLRIEGRSNGIISWPPKPVVVCTLRIEGRSNIKINRDACPSGCVYPSNRG